MDKEQLILKIRGIIEEEKAIISDNTLELSDDMYEAINDSICKLSKFVNGQSDGISNTYNSVRVNSSHLSSNTLEWGKYMSCVFNDPDDFWALSCNDGIYIEPGIDSDGSAVIDRYKLCSYGDVHGLIVGAPGSGKAVYVNHLIATMTSRYSPWELELWLADFRGVEFPIYLGNSESAKMLPHIKACVCTSDISYAGYLFNALKRKADARYNTITLASCKNIAQYNMMMEKEGKLEYRLPRIVVFVDEFQNIFTKADDKTVDSVKCDLVSICKVARACGIHFMFSSHMFNDIASGEILDMFTLRMCLRSGVELSERILGTPYASQIKDMYGYLYVSSVNDTSREEQKKFATPYISDSALRCHINRCYNEAARRGWKANNIIKYE